jgi:hypothetical protein
MSILIHVNKTLSIGISVKYGTLSGGVQPDQEKHDKFSKNSLLDLI